MPRMCLNLAAACQKHTAQQASPVTFLPPGEPCLACGFVTWLEWAWWLSRPRATSGVGFAAATRLLVPVKGGGKEGGSGLRLCGLPVNIF